MGQYFTVFNLDKRETLNQFRFGRGLKLMETCRVGDPFTNALTHLLANDWHGDKVLYCGDYAWEESRGQSWSKPLHSLVDENPFEGKDTFADRSTDFISAKDASLVLEPVEGAYDVDSPTMRYVINETLGVYYDRTEAPVSDVSWWKGEPVINRIDALPLFLALGNDLGSGDYRGTDAANMQLVGSWAGHVIGASDEAPRDMRKITCPFDPKGMFITESDELVCEAMAASHLDWGDTTIGELAKALADMAPSEGLCDVEESARVAMSKSAEIEQGSPSQEEL